MLEVERAYFEKSKADLQSRFPGMIVVIKGEEIIGAYNIIQEGLAEGVRRFGLNGFLVREVGYQAQEIFIPALTLGILRANPAHSGDRSEEDS